MEKERKEKINSTNSVEIGSKLVDVPKGMKYDFAYQEGEKTPPICGKCRYFVKGRKCQLVKGDIDPINGSCNFWVKGSPKTDLNSTPPFTKNQSGYVEHDNGPRCSQCVFFSIPSKCHLVMGKINGPLGCCNAFLPRKKS